MKKWLAAFLGIVLLLLLTVPVFGAGSDISVVINGKTLVCDDKPINESGRILLPVRALSEAMGCEVTWVPSMQLANIENDSTKIAMKINSTMIAKQRINGDGEQTVIKTDVPPRIIASRTYIPARAFAEALGAVVGWDANTRTVMIVYDTALNYASGYTVETFAGNGERTQHDSGLSTMSFVSPESIAVNQNGGFVVTDGGSLRILSSSGSETIKIEPSYISASSAKCYGDNTYILTNEFMNSDNVKYYGIVRLSQGSAEGVFITEAKYSTIPDFDIANDGTLYCIYENLGVGKNYLARINLGSGSVEYLQEIKDGIKTLAVDDSGNIFLGNTVNGSIYFYNAAAGTIKLFAGVNDSIKFVDGTDPRFFEPRQLEYHNGSLYVLDYNILRRLSVNSAHQLISSETIAGKITADQNPETVNGPASGVTFSPSYLMDFAVTDSGIYLTDPKNAVIRVIRRSS